MVRNHLHIGAALASLVLLGTLGSFRVAQASTILSFRIEWVATTSTAPESLASLGTDHYVGAPGDQVTASLLFSVAEGWPISTYSATLRFDGELTDQLDVITFEHEVAIFPNESTMVQHVIPVLTESTDFQEGIINGFSHQTFTNLPVGPFEEEIGTVVFELNEALSTVGTSVRFDFYVDGRDGWIDGDLVYRRDGAEFFSATVTAVPEPSRLALLVFGTGLLSAVARSQRMRPVRGALRH